MVPYPTTCPAMLHAFALAFRQLGDRRMLMIFVKSLAITLVVFAALGVGLYFLLEMLTAKLVGPQSSGLVATLAFAMGIALFWLTFRAIAVAVVGLFADEVVAVVEGRSYPRALASARHVSFARSAIMGLRSVGRLVAFNLLARAVVRRGGGDRDRPADRFLRGERMAAWPRPGRHGGGAAPRSGAAQGLAGADPDAALAGGGCGERAVRGAGRQPGRAGGRRGGDDPSVPSGARRMKIVATLAGALVLGACATTEPAKPVVAVPIPFRSDGPAMVMGKNAGQLVALFGAPNAEVREGPGRKLQFASAICVLDAYLYPRGEGQAVVTHVDARQTDGSPIDRASCVAALQRRGGGK